jgi:hypothetical protein
VAAARVVVEPIVGADESRIESVAAAEKAVAES